MNAEPALEEQKRAKRIIKRWNRYYYCWFMSNFLVFTTIWFFLPISKDFRLFSNFFLFFAASMFMAYVLNDRIARIFASKLSQDDRNLIRGIDALSIKGNHFDDLHKACKVDAPKELLRASAPNQNDGTLLRASAYNNETSKDEMLRASNTPVE